MRSYLQTINNRKAEFGDKFSDVALSKQFIKYYENGKRIKVLFPDGSYEYGSVGMTTGWIPCFLLIHKSTDLGSSTVLSDKDKIIAVKVGKGYLSV